MSFLSAFFEPAEKVCFRVFSDKKDNAFAGAKLEKEQGLFQQIAHLLQNHNEQGRGIFFVVNFGGHEDENIKRVNAQFVEMDTAPLDEQLQRVQAFPLEPSLIVKTRKSLHCYWLMKEASVSKFRHIQKQLVVQFDGDPACVNESRVFRLPGFFHCKQEPVLVECIKFNPELRYTQDELSAVLHQIPEEETHEKVQFINRGTQSGLTLMGRRCNFMQHCKRNAKSLSEPDWYAMITNLAVFEGGESAIHKLSKPYPKYNSEQTQAKIDHYYKSGTKPMTCRKIAENGFVCPRLKDGSCRAKAPAGLAYFPLSGAELTKMLTSYKPKRTAIENTEIARWFISDCLYNVEPGIAEVFIRNNMREYFGLKAADVKSFPGFQRELFQAFSSTREARQQRAGGEMPEWYEFTKNGGLHFMPGMLANHLMDNFHAFYTAEQYYYYQDGVYSTREDKDAKATMRTYLNPRDATMNQINDAEGQWQLIIRKPIREVNPNPYIINTKNGLYNVLDDSFRPHDPHYYSTVQMKAKYDPEADCPRFMEFLHSILESPEIELIQEIFGYILVPVTKAQKSFVLVGLANVGKSTLMQVMQDVLLGKENVCNIPIQKLDERFQPAELFGKLANIYADLANKKIDDVVGMFKAVTGEDYITGERKHKDPFSFKPYARFLYSCNDIPRNYGDRSEAFYRRLIIIRFSKPVPKGKRDLRLKEKLAAERDGILAWAIIGLKRLMANNYQFTETDKTNAELNAYKIENNNVLAFVEECCTLEPNAVCLRQEAFDAYKEFCSENNHGAMSQPHFKNEVSSIEGVTEGLDSTTRRKIWRGIRLN
jgi:putative DNA primase/helicase